MITNDATAVGSKAVDHPASSVEADSMVCPKLGRVCIYHDGDWGGKWIRRGDTNVFDCEMRHGPARETANYVATIELRDGKVVIYRTQYRSTRTGVNPPEGTCDWTGTLSKDGTEVRWGAASYLRAAE
jgi:hypothetical protein